MTIEQAVETVLSLTATLAAGNTSATATVTVERAGPAAPDAAIALNCNGTTVTGTAEPGATVIASDADGIEVGTATADAATGAFSVRLTSPQADGSSLAVVVRNTAGATSANAIVTVLLPPVSVPTPPDGLSSNGTTITGAAQPGRTIILRDANGTEGGMGTTDATTGTFTVTLTPAQANGAQLTVVARDDEGEESVPAAVTVTVPQPNVSLSSDGSRVAGAATNGVELRVTGPDGTVLGRGTAGDDGTFNILLSPVQLRGTQLTVVGIAPRRARIGQLHRGRHRCSNSRSARRTDRAAHHPFDWGTDPDPHG